MFGFGDVQDGQGAALETSPGEKTSTNLQVNLKLTGGVLQFGLLVMSARLQLQMSGLGSSILHIDPAQPSV